MNTNARNDNYTILKVYTTILVVVAHVTRMYTGYGAIEMPIDPFLKAFTEVIYKFHMPLFIFLSGAVYSVCIKKGKYLSYTRFVLGKFRRLLIPFLIWGIFYVAPVITYLGINDYSYVENVIYGILLQGDTRHLWFLSTLFAIFVIVHAVVTLLRKRSWKFLAGLFIAVILVAALTFPTLLSYVSFVGYLAYFVMGIIADHYSDRISKICERNWWLCVPLLLVVTVISQFCKGFLFDTTAAVLGIAASYLLISKIGKTITEMPLYATLVECGMGIYLIHPMVIYLLFDALKSYAINPYLMSVIIFVVSFAVSVVGTKAIKAFRLNHLLLGE